LELQKEWLKDTREEINAENQTELDELNELKEMYKIMAEQYVNSQKSIQEDKQTLQQS
jgi:hypothetical protein